MSNFVIPEIKAAEEEMIAIRHYLHAHPELSLKSLIPASWWRKNWRSGVMR